MRIGCWPRCWLLCCRCPFRCSFVEWKENYTIVHFFFFCGEGISTSPSQQSLHYFSKNNKAPGGPFSSSAVPYNQLQPPLPQPQPQHHVMTQQQLYQHKNFQMQQQMFAQQPYVALNSLNSLSGPRPVCGVQPLKSSKLQKRIIGGDQAAFGEFPWQAHIRIAGFQCGGVLLNNQYIATAAHCVHRYKCVSPAPFNHLFFFYLINAARPMSAQTRITAVHCLCLQPRPLLLSYCGPLVLSN